MGLVIVATTIIGGGFYGMAPHHKKKPIGLPFPDEQTI
jgi:hypothetical protein